MLSPVNVESAHFAVSAKPMGVSEPARKSRQLPVVQYDTLTEDFRWAESLQLLLYWVNLYASRSNSVSTTYSH